MYLVSTHACPSCGHMSTETMPTDVCHLYYECKGCGTLLRPKAGNCSVFCCYGDVPCPPGGEATGPRRRLLLRSSGRKRSQVGDDVTGEVASLSLLWPQQTFSLIRCCNLSGLRVT